MDSYAVLLLIFKSLIYLHINPSPSDPVGAYRGALSKPIIASKLLSAIHRSFILSKISFNLIFAIYPVVGIYCTSLTLCAADHLLYDIPLLAGHTVEHAKLARALEPLAAVYRDHIAVDIG